jgi:diaminopimelate decarboxylase
MPLGNLHSPIQTDNSRYSLQGIDLLALCKDYGTPAFVYDLNHIIKQYKSLFHAIRWPKLKIYYAMKANYNLDILKALKAEGAGIDAVSPAEALLALKTGFPKERLLYTANNLTDDELRAMKNVGVLMNIDSLSCLKKCVEAFPNSEVCLRFNSDVVAGESEKIQTGGDKTKFGIRLEDAPKALEIAAEHKVKIVGLHEHTGSGIAKAEEFCQGMKNLLSIAKRDSFPDLRFIDFGGGFKVPYRPDEKPIDYKNLGAEIVKIVESFCASYGRELELVFEPGKYIVAEAGILLTQVNTLKANKKHLFAGTDTGFSHLIRPILYNAYHHIVNLSNPQGTPKKHDICGNICETGDLFASGRMIPEIREGDYLAILNAGAYCFSMASIYNLRPLPCEIAIRDGKSFLSRERTTPEALVNEIVASHAHA